MATSYINLTGKARFIKNLFAPDEAFGASRYKATIYLDDENLAKYKQSGIQVTPKNDDKGTHITLSRDTVKMISGQPVYFTPPYIKNKDMTYLVQYLDDKGNQIRQYQDVNVKNKIVRQGDPFLIGNDSLVELNVCVFDTKTRGKGHRLEGIRILDLIEYKKPEETQTTESVVPESTSVETPVKNKKAPW